jgi:aspartate ammonia-lyase
MNCKYCHLKTHYIDKCPTIICKICKEIGHPQWLCKEKKSSKSNKNINTISLEKKYYFSDEIKKNSSSENITQKNINYYLNMEKELWGNLVTI